MDNRNSQQMRYRSTHELGLHRLLNNNKILLPQVHKLNYLVMDYKVALRLTNLNY